LGYLVSWGTFWSIVSEAGDDGHPSAESVTLQDHTGRTQVTMVSANRCEMLDPGETVRFWNSPGYLSSFMEPGTIVAISEHNRCAGAIVLVGPGEDDGELMVTVKEIYSTGMRASVRVTLTTPLETFDEVYRMAQETLQIDHRPMFRFFASDVLDAVLG